MKSWRSVLRTVLFLSLLLAYPYDASGCETDGRYIMGTVFQMTLCHDESMSGTHRRQRMQDVFTTAKRFDDLFTTYAPHSPLSHLNAQAGQGFQTVPQEVIDILRLSQRYTQLTHGAFDITIRPLLTAWRRAEKSQQPPKPAVISHALLSIGSQKIQFAVPNQVALPTSEMALDLGGIGKGYALDQIANQLREQHVTDALLNFGQSSLWALGQPRDADGWRLLLRQPNGKAVGVATFSDQAISVSGSLGQSLQVGGHRYGHIIDPRTGQPVQRDLLACIVASSAAQAEALSTALLILGEDEGLALIEKLDGVEGILLEADGERWMTTGWKRASHFAAL